MLSIRDELCRFIRLNEQEQWVPSGDALEQIQALQAMKRSLKKLIDQCQKRGTLDDCPLLYGLTPPKTASSK